MIQRDRWGRLTETEWKSPTSVAPTFMCLIDRKGRAQFVREAPIKGLGYSEEEFLGRPFWETGLVWPVRGLPGEDRYCCEGCPGR